MVKNKITKSLLLLSGYVRMPSTFYFTIFYSLICNFHCTVDRFPVWLQNAVEVSEASSKNVILLQKITGVISNN